MTLSAHSLRDIRRCDLHSFAAPALRLCFLSVLLPLVLLQSGCGAKEEKRYPIQAEVISVNLPNKLITIKHGEIPGLMPAMTMSYMVAVPKEAENLGPGDKITAELVVSESKGHLEKIVLVEKAKPAPAPVPATQGSPHT